MNDLFAALQSPSSRNEPLDEGALLLRGFAVAEQQVLWEAVQAVAEAAPFRHMVTPGGKTMSVAMTNCGELGWVTDRKGYRYAPADPESGKPWPALPAVVRDLSQRAAAAAGFPGYDPDSCLVNRYRPGARLTLHQDLNERDFSHPIVSLSLGLPATFRWGGQKRADNARRLRLESGDVVVWGGPARMTFHGVDDLKDGVHPLTGECRINLTLRMAG